MSSKKEIKKSITMTMYELEYIEKRKEYFKAKEDLKFLEGVVIGKKYDGYEYTKSQKDSQIKDTIVEIHNSKKIMKEYEAEWIEHLKFINKIGKKIEHKTKTYFTTAWKEEEKF